MSGSSSDPSFKSSSYIAQRRTINSLTLWEKLDCVAVIASALSNTLFALVTGLFRHKGNRKRAFSKYIFNTIARTVTRRASPRQQHCLLPPTDDSYKAVCKKYGVEPRSETLEDGTQAHWIGNPTAKNVIINFHGGGYCLPGSVGQFSFMFQLISRVESAGKSAAVLFLSYDLSPTAPYPRSLSQAVSLLKHVLDVLHFPPENIILTGDSAGGNLALGVLSHITHPHPDSQIPRLTLPSPVKGAILISPWVSFTTTHPSFTKNKYLDDVAPPAIKQWSEAFLGVFPADNYSEPILAPPTWWAHLPVAEVLIVYGADETLCDGIREFNAKFKEGFEIIAPGTFSSSRVSTSSGGENTGWETESHFQEGEFHLSQGETHSSETHLVITEHNGGNGVGEREEGGGLKKGEKRLAIVEVPGEYHIEMYVDLQKREERECVQGRGVKEWIMRRL